MLKLFKKEIQNVEFWQCKKKTFNCSALREHGQDEVYAVFKILFDSVFVKVAAAISSLEDNKNRI